MKFSVVIPTHNEEKYLKTALEALKNQDISPENYEIVVVDYKSTDKTVQIAKDAGCKVVQEKQKGSNSGRHRGFLVSQGEIKPI